MLTAAAAVVGLMGITVAHFWIAMILLGVGWNFGFVGASTMVAQSCEPSERNKAQAFNDFTIFGIMALGSFSSGQILMRVGWDTVNDVVFPPVVVATDFAFVLSALAQPAGALGLKSNKIAQIRFKKPDRLKVVFASRSQVWHDCGAPKSRVS